MKKPTKILLVSSVLNCGIATTIINGIISYFALSKGTMLFFQDLIFNFFSIIIGCGIFCPLFSNIVLKKLQKKNNIFFGEKSKHVLARLVPNRHISGTIVICILSMFIFGCIPYFFIQAVCVDLVLKVTEWCLILGVYSGLVATFSMYLGIIRARYSQIDEERYKDEHEHKERRAF